MEKTGDGSILPLLDHSHKGSSSQLQTLVNIVVSIIGTGVLSLPFAFRIAGWLAGSFTILATGALIYYSMMLLVVCRDKLVAEDAADVQTYGDLGGAAFGRAGRFLTEFLIIMAQCGGAVAYLVFIGQNLSSVFPDSAGITSSTLISFLVPIQIALSFIRSLSNLAPFSAFADVCNVLAMLLVVKEDLQLFEGFKEIKPVIGFGSLPFAAGVAVFCFEGFGMTLALEGSMRERGSFKKVLLVAFSLIMTVYVSFGFLGYLAYGVDTKDIITLNLSNSWSAVAIKVALCVALTFTFPIMMHPVYEIIEAKVKKNVLFWKFGCSSWTCEQLNLHTIRALAVMMLAVTASFVPAFGSFVSLVGSTVCALLSFVLPAIFHLMFMGSTMGLWQKAVDVCIGVSGLAFACYETYNTACHSFPHS